MSATASKVQRIPDNVGSPSTRIAKPALDGFEQFSFEADGNAHAVYYCGRRRDPPLLLMPEIAGLSPGLILFAKRLRSVGFQVYLPWLFGPFQKRAPVRNYVRLCISREFSHLRGGTSAPVASWLRRLAGHISDHNGGSRIGAIGMCLTGALAIPLVIDPRVVAAVAAQPAVPCSLLFAAFGIPEPRMMAALNVSDSDIAQARDRLATGETRMFAVRSRADRLCPAAKLERLRREFPVGLTTSEYGTESSRNMLGARPHALFTKEYRLVPDASPDHWSRQAFDDLVAFFREHLRREHT